MKRDSILFSKLFCFKALYDASLRAWKGRKHQRGFEALHFMYNRDQEVLNLQAQLLSETWEPSPLRAFVIRDPKLRLICAAPFKDRVVHHALCYGIQPRIDRYLAPQSHACRTGYGSHSALKSAQNLAKNSNYILRLDIAHYFETISHSLLNEQFARLFKGQALLRLFALIIAQKTPFGPLNRGLPIGSLTSQFAANLFLAQLDHYLLRSYPIRYVRYMDDLVIGVSCKKQAWQVHDAVQEHLTTLQLKLKKSATCLSAQSAGFNFLGFRIWPYRMRLDSARRRRFIRKVIKLKQLTQSDSSSWSQHDLQIRSQGLNAWAAMAHTRGFRTAVWQRHFHEYI